ncbi:MAG TPA: hypothetical protein VHA56_16210 [Mucilaginibacter sp.]|nr:hypothetical protein [Mucilaginibacter sp.]
MAKRFENMLQEATILTEKARLNNCWIFDTRLRVWHTPEFFINMIEGEKILGYDFRLSHYIVADPRRSLKPLFDDLRKQIDKLEDFTRKVTNYYNSHTDPNS